MGYRYAVLGAGMQGTAVAFDLASFADADEVRLFDIRHDKAERAAADVNALTRRPVVKPGFADASDRSRTSQVLEGMHACLSALPPYFADRTVRAAVDAGVHFADLGGDPAVKRAAKELDAEAKRRRLSLVPGVGAAPGLANVLAAAGVRAMEAPRSVSVLSGALPEQKGLPLGFKLLHGLEALTLSYTGRTSILRGGRVVEVDALGELERIEFPAPLGTLEAFVTAGGASSAPEVFLGRLEDYVYKTLRYPGHHVVVKALADAGFFSEEPIAIGAARVAPAEVFRTLMGRAWDRPDERDVFVLRADVLGRHEGRQVRWRAELFERSGRSFSAIARTSAAMASIALSMQVAGQVAPGALPVEVALDPDPVVAAIHRRGLSLSTSWSTLA